MGSFSTVKFNFGWYPLSASRTGSVSPLFRLPNRDVNDKVPSEKKKSFHEYLRSYTNRFANNIYQTKDYTFKKLHALKSKGDIVILSGEKDSCVLILNKTDYVKMVDNLIEEGIRDGVYEYTTDRTHKDLANYRSFLNYHFSKNEFYQDIWTDKNQPGRLFCSAKTHKFEKLEAFGFGEFMLIVFCKPWANVYNDFVN